MDPELAPSAASLAAGGSPLPSDHVSIGLPVYNGARYLAETLDGALAQTHRNFSIIVSDNGSTDDTLAILDRYVRLDPRIRVIAHERNRGPAWNFEFVRTQAEGSYFKWMAHDDLHASTYLERCVAALEADPEAVIAQPRAIYIDSDGAELLRSFRNAPGPAAGPAARLRYVLERAHDFTFGFGVIRMPALRQLSPWRSRYGADELLLAELALLGRFVEPHAHLFMNRLHPGRSMVANSGIRQRLYWNSWWAATPARGAEYPSWRFLADLLAIVRRSPISVAERRECLSSIALWIRWYWPHLAIDVPLGIEQWWRVRSAS